MLDRVRDHVSACHQHLYANANAAEKLKQKLINMNSWLLAETPGQTLATRPVRLPTVSLFLGHVEKSETETMIAFLICFSGRECEIRIQRTNKCMCWVN